MNSFNRVILLGNLTRDPQIGQTTGGTATATFSLAVNKKLKDPATGEKKETVSYIDIVVYGKQADNCGKYLHKGDAALVEGELRQRRWDDKTTGEKRRKVEVKADGVTFMPRGGGRGPVAGGQEGELPPGVKDAFPGSEPVPEDEIPF